MITMIKIIRSHVTFMLRGGLRLQLLFTYERLANNVVQTRLEIKPKAYHKLITN